MNHEGNNTPFFVMVVPSGDSASSSSVSATGTSGDNGGNSVENRLTKLEKDVEYIQKDISAIESNVSNISLFVDKVKSKAIIWLAGVVITLLAGQGLLGLALT